MKLILKISGEILKKDTLQENLNELKDFIQSLLNDHHKIAIIIGGGNYFRGKEHLEMIKNEADTIGMVASVMNALYISEYFKRNNINNIIKTPFVFNGLVPLYDNNQLVSLYEDNVLIFGGGKGIIGCSTDALCFNIASLLKTDYIIKLTNVDGIYDKDPNKYSDAMLLKHVSYDKVINESLEVMDIDMVKNCKNHNICIKIMNYKDKYKLLNKNIGSIIGEKCEVK